MRHFAHHSMPNQQNDAAADVDVNVDVDVERQGRNDTDFLRNENQDRSREQQIFDYFEQSRGIAVSSI